MISALPVSGAAQPKMIGAHMRPAEQLVHQRQLELAVSLSARAPGSRWHAQRSRSRTSCLSWLIERAQRAGGALEHVDVEHLVERLDLLADERVHPVELLLELRLGAESPTRWRSEVAGLVAGVQATDVAPRPAQPADVVVGGDVVGEDAGRGETETMIEGRLRSSLAAAAESDSEAARRLAGDGAHVAHLDERRTSCNARSRASPAVRNGGSMLRRRRRDRGG